MLKNYLKIAARNFLQSKFYNSLSVLGLAVGISSCLLLLLYVQTELSYDVFHEDAGRIFRVITGPPGNEDYDAGFARVGAPWGPAMKSEMPEVEDYVRFRFVGTALVERGEKKLYEPDGLYADPSVLTLFSFPLKSGDRDTALSDPGAVVLTEIFASRFFGEEDPVGRDLSIDGSVFRVSAVLENIPVASHMHFDYLLPFSVHAANRPDWMDLWNRYNYHVYIRLDNTDSEASVEQKLNTLLPKHLDSDLLSTTQAYLQPVRDIHLYSHLGREFEANANAGTIFLLAGVALFILVIASINFMNLATARSTRRAREVGLRKVLGADRLRLATQFFGEAVFITLLSLVLAVVIVITALPTFNAIAGVALILDFERNRMIWVFICGIGVFVALFSGIYPALFLSSFAPAQVLRSSGGSGSSSTRMRKLLVVGQFTISIALIAGVGVTMDQIEYMQSKDPGFEMEHIVVVPLRDPEADSRFESLRSAFEEIPGVERVTASSGNLGGGDWGVTFRAEGSDTRIGDGTRVLVVDEHYFDTLQLDLVEGRAFSLDFASDETDAFIINETLASRLEWDDPVGHRIEIPNWRAGQIIGVVKDFHFRSLHESIDPMLMFIQRDTYGLLSARVKSDDLEGTLASMATVWGSFAPAYPFDYSFVDETFGDFYDSDRRFSKVIRFFAAIALLIACLGLFGLSAYAAERRTKEIGIRKVLGATTVTIIGLLSREFALLVGIAIGFAVPLSFVAMQAWLQSFAYRAPISPLTLATAAVLALMIAFLTVAYHAAKTALNDPVLSLRCE